MVNILLEMRQLPQWVLWRAERRSNGPTKVPYRICGEPARVNDSGTWCPYGDARAALSCGRFIGLGFVFTDSDPFIGVDLDNCLTGGQLKQWALPYVEGIKDSAYIEVSPSGLGLKAWLFAPGVDLPGRRLAVGDGSIEIYTRRRFFAFTSHGWPVSNEANGITASDGQEASSCLPLGHAGDIHQHTLETSGDREPLSWSISDLERNVCNDHRD